VGTLTSVFIAVIQSHESVPYLSTVPQRINSVTMIRW
jgi:hypothetical protein